MSASATQGGHNRGRGQAGRVRRNLEWRMLMQIVPRSVMFQNFKHRNCLYYNARRGHGQENTAQNSLELHFKLKIQSFLLGRARAYCPRLLRWEEYSSPFPSLVPNQVFWTRPCVPRIPARFAPITESVNVAHRIAPFGQKLLVRLFSLTAAFVIATSQYSTCDQNACYRRLRSTK